MSPDVEIKELLATIGRLYPGGVPYVRNAAECGDMEARKLFEQYQRANKERDRMEREQ